MLKMALGTVWMTRYQNEVEKKSADGLLLRKVIEHSRNAFIPGRRSFHGGVGEGSSQVDHRPGCGCRHFF